MSGEQSLYPLIQAYFLEAFSVPLVRGLSPVDNYQHADLRYAFLNDQLLYELIQNRSQWETVGAEVNGAACWLEQVTSTDDLERLRRAAAVPVPELMHGRGLMTQEEREYIALSAASAKGLSEKVRALSNLVEVLQQRVNELEVASTPA